MLSRTILSFLLLSLIGTLFAQDADPILFKVEDNEVRVSEFDYIYNKNNGNGADYSEASLNEYLDLYTKFKLKVQRAKELKLDTIVSLQNELAGYRRQLADTYLVDKEVHNKLLDEVFQRMQIDRSIAHVFVALPEKSGEQVTKTATDKINKALKSLDEGATWDHVTKTYSEDTNTSGKGGQLGFFTAMLPSGFYAFENAMYQTEIGKYSKVVRSSIGFHIIKVLEERPARGEMEVAHIFLKKGKTPDKMKNQVNIKIDSIHQLLESGANFEALAKHFSEDKKTASKGGYLGWFGIKKYDIGFENTAFNLPSDGSYSQPFETKTGHHIVQRLAKRDFTDMKRLKGRIENQLKKDDRLKLAKAALVKEIQKQSGFKADQKVLDDFVGSLTEEFYSFKWQPQTAADKTLFSFGDKLSASIDEFATHCKKNTRKRLAFKKDKPIADAVNELYEAFIEVKALEYEESNLENKYPEFKALMREYEEGILLFEITKQEVWDKASKDSLGLNTFFEANKQSYNWKERAEVMVFEVNSTDKDLIKQIRKAAKKSSREEILGKFNSPQKQVVNIKEKVYEKGDQNADSFKWKKDQVSDEKTENGKTTFVKVLALMDPGPKQLNEARGYIIADYQDHLEKEWVSFLRSRYNTDIDQKVFKSLIK